MSQLARQTTWASLQTLTAANLNGEFDNIVNGWNNTDAGTNVWTVVNSAAYKKSGFTGIIPLQVIQGTTSTAFNTTSATFAASGLSVTITPQSTSSKILVHAVFSFKNSSLSGDSGFATLQRGATNLGGTSGFFILAGNFANSIEVPAAMTYLDSPASTSALTYQVYLRTTAGSSTISMNNNNTCQAAIVAIELL